MFKKTKKIINNIIDSLTLYFDGYSKENNVFNAIIRSNELNACDYILLHNRDLLKHKTKLTKK